VTAAPPSRATTATPTAIPAHGGPLLSSSPASPAAAAADGGGDPLDWPDSLGGDVDGDAEPDGDTTGAARVDASSDGSGVVIVFGSRDGSAGMSGLGRTDELADEGADDRADDVADGLAECVGDGLDRDAAAWGQIVLNAMSGGWRRPPSCQTQPSVSPGSGSWLAAPWVA
jgi:hypothetical protein